MASIDGRSRRRIITAVLAMAGVLSLAAAGCGKPEFTYITNNDDKTYFKVPYAWAKIDERPIDSLVSGIEQGSAAAVMHKNRLWSVAYDADTEPSSSHMTSFMSSEAPVIYAAVQHLASAEQDVISLDFMRDVHLPVTDNLRQRYEQAGFPLTDFELLSDEVRSPSPGIHGVRVIYNYRFPTGVFHTFDQTVYVNNDASTLYLLIVRCTFACYRERKAEIDTVVTSFTVRSPL